MEKNITPLPFPTPSAIDEKGMADYVTRIYDYSGTKANQAIDWYLAKKRSKQKAAQVLRFLAIALTTAGGLVPLIIASHVLPPSTTSTPQLEYGQFGYVALALAGASIAMDKFFGFSSGWMRYVTAAMKLQRLRDQFNVDWAVLNSAVGAKLPSAAEREVMLKRAGTFLASLMEEVESETSAWAAEYRSNLSELEKSARQQLDANKPGVINLTVKSATTVPGAITVILDGVPRQTITGSECQLSPVFPGEHFLEISATVAGKTVTSGSPVRIEPGQSMPVALSLPTAKLDATSAQP